MNDYSLSREQIVQAFMDWETGVRTNPEDYRSRDEVVCMAVSETAKESADHFIALIEKAKKKA